MSVEKCRGEGLSYRVCVDTELWRRARCPRPPLNTSRRMPGSNRRGGFEDQMPRPYSMIDDSDSKKKQEYTPLSPITGVIRHYLGFFHDIR